MKFALVLFLAACTVDVDGDGYSVDVDCDDSDAGKHDGVTVSPDADGDGFGDPDAAELRCEAPAGWVANGDDCDDGDSAAHPDAVELCDALDVDEDCNDLADDDDPGADADGMVRAWEDGDGDGFGNAASHGLFCDVPPDHVEDATDCDDSDPSVGARVLWYRDSDGDSYGDPTEAEASCEPSPGYVADGTDCDDAQADVSPSAREYCDGEDDDCDGELDEPDAEDAPSWYLDGDSDGHGDAAVPLIQCYEPAGYVADATDCDDTASDVHPGLLELCDAANVDEDCNGAADDADAGATTDGMTTFYADSDGDSYGDSAAAWTVCDPPPGAVTDGTDCDDTDAEANPGATEVCDAGDVDEDCDGAADNGDASVDPSTEITYFYDGDHDGYGNSSIYTATCDHPTFVVVGGDCNDADATISPGGFEICDAGDVDEDCDGLADDADASVLGSSYSTFFVDTDGDGHGAPADTAAACDVPAGYAETDDDCAPTNPAISPGAAEVCGDAVDDNCDGSTACTRYASDADRKFVGEAASDYVGARLGPAGDLDGDGVVDILIGSSSSDRGGLSAGAAWVITGGESGDLDLSAAAAILVGEDAADLAGTCTAGVGDLDGDGYDDFAVGALGEDEGGSSAGKLYVLRGPKAGVTDLSTAYADFVGETASDVAGRACANAGDVNGDGRPDILVGATGYSGRKGAAYLITSVPAGTTDLSAAAARMYGERVEDQAGYAVDGAGDLDGDGYADLIVGAPLENALGSSSGAAYVVYGPHAGSAALSAADAKLRGNAAGIYAGEIVRGVGDLDADGYDDVAVGASGSTGVIYLVHGPISGTSTLSAIADVSLGTGSGDIGSALDVADADGDGVLDLAIGNDEAGAVEAAGETYIILGPLSGSVIVETEAAVTFAGTDVDDGLGMNVSFIEAQDGRSGHDLLIGVLYDDEGGSEAGAVLLFSLADL